MPEVIRSLVVNTEERLLITTRGAAALDTTS